MTAGVELIRAGDYFAAHEALEDDWRAAPAAERDFLQGLVHVAVAWYQAGRGNRVGCGRQLEKATRRLGDYAPEHRGVDVARLLDSVAAATAVVASGSLELPPPSLDAPCERSSARLNGDVVPVLHDADQQQLDRVVALLREVLATEVVGAYLFGSAVLGGLRPESDLDVLAVTRRRTTVDEKKRLVERLLSISGRRTPQGRWRRLELTIVVQSEIKPWRFPPSHDFQYGDWFRSEFESGNLEPWPTTTNPDLAALITLALLGHTTLLGLPPAEVFDPVPRRDLVRAGVGGAEGLLGELEDDTRNVILTLARIWTTAATGTIRSKDEAAAWALERLPDEHRAVLARARAIYVGEEEERWDDLGTLVRAHAEHVAAEIERLAGYP